jgi:mRNA interferase HigB
VKVISRKALLAFVSVHPEAAEPLDNWHRRARKADWDNLLEVRNDFPHADGFGYCTVFNIAGNKYRLVTWIAYRKQAIHIRFVLTHAEYNKNGWKNDC